MTPVSFDSNILIDALGDHPLARAELVNAGQSWISRVTWIEVMSKIDESNMARTVSLLSAFHVDEVDLDIAERAAALRNERRSLKLPDAVIFASAQARGRILVTRNTRDFPADMPGVRVPYTL